MENKSMTAVEWLVSQLKSRYDIDIERLSVTDKAKKMFEQQIMEAFDNGDHCIDLPDGSWKQKYDSPEQYYNETYK